jgi:transposase-like protein
VYRAVDQPGQVIDVLVSARRDANAARRFFRRALSTLKVTPTEVVTDAAAVHPAVPDELIPAARHHVEQYPNNPIAADHSQPKHRPRPTRGLRTDRTAQVVTAGHAAVHNLRRSHDEPRLDTQPALRLAVALTELAQTISARRRSGLSMTADPAMQRSRAERASGFRKRSQRRRGGVLG